MAATILDESKLLELLIKCDSVEEAMALVRALVPFEYLQYPISRWFDEITFTFSPEDLDEVKAIVAASKDIQP